MMVWVLLPFAAIGFLWVTLMIHQVIRMARFKVPGLGRP